jgi:hypothetical protein
VGARVARDKRVVGLIELLGRQTDAFQRATDDAAAAAAAAAAGGIGDDDGIAGGGGGSDSVDASAIEELILNVVSCLTNLSFYQPPPSHNDDDNDGDDDCDVGSGGSGGGGGGGGGGNNVGGERRGMPVLFAQRDAVLARLLPLLFSANNEVVCESVRALGNLSRDAALRAGARRCRLDETMVVLLDHGDCGYRGFAPVLRATFSLRVHFNLIPYCSSYDLCRRN